MTFVGTKCYSPSLLAAILIQPTQFQPVGLSQGLVQLMVSNQNQ